MSDSDKKFSIFMRELRIKAVLTVDEAARRIGVGISTIEDCEKGVSFPSELSVQRISSIYKVSQQDWLKALREHCNSLLSSNEV